MYSTSDINIIGKSYQTKDGLYHTTTSSPSWYYKPDGKKVEYNVGYAYWYDGTLRMGHTSYDYLFFTGKEGIERAIALLNKLLYERDLNL